MRTIYGLIRSFNSKRFWAPLGATAVLATATVAWAVTPTSVFEIDGDVTNGNSGPAFDDWNLLNGNCLLPGGGSGSAGGSNTRTCIASEDPPRIFTQGGSKDPNDVSQWHWKAADTVPDKDTITHGYAASYTATIGASVIADKVVVIGGDRFAVNGDANIGAWFFQQNISLNSDGTFSGVHVNHDVFLVSAFVNGGGTAVLTAYEWDSSCLKGLKNPSPGQCAETNLRLLGSSDTSAITNSSPISDEAWSYLAKFGGGTNTIPVGGFFEGGADLTALFAASGAGDVPCFSSFMLETRSSQEPSAVLKDFVLGGFPECHLKATKTVQCTSFNANGSFNYTYSGTVINDGGGDLFNVNVTDVKGETYSCGSLPKGTSKTFGGSPLSTDCTITTGSNATFTTTNHPASNQATATATTSSSGGTTLTADTGSVLSTDAVDSNGNSLCSARPGLAVTKRCVTNFQLGANVVEVRVDYTGEVTNTGNDNLNNVNVTEAASGTPDRASFGPFDLIPGQSICYTNNAATCPPLSVVQGLTTNPPTNSGAASYIPSGANILATLAGRIEFSDTVTATATDAFNQPVPKLGDPPVTATAHCVICPFGACATQ
jgi:hypothetical protein